MDRAIRGSREFLRARMRVECAPGDWHAVWLYLRFTLSYRDSYSPPPGSATPGALPSVVSRVSEIRDPGRTAGRIGVRFDPLQGRELGFDSGRQTSVPRLRRLSAGSKVLAFR